MSNICPTVKVKSDTEGGHVIINESDFDPAVHERFEPPALPLPPVPAAPDAS